MGSGKFSIDHDHFVAKNRSLAAAEEVHRKDKAMERKGFSQMQRQQEASCFNCKLKKKCPEFRTSKTGVTTGAASFGGAEKQICDKYQPAPAENRNMSEKQIKSLLKNFKRQF